MGATAVPKVLLVAEEAAGVQVLRKLVARDVDVVVLTSEPEDATRGATVWHLARSKELEVLDPLLVKQAAFADEIRRREIDVMLNVHSLAIAAGAVVGAPRIGSFNLHPGPLPRYAGLNAPSWAILAGEPEHGVTLHWMDAEIDTGDIAYQTLFPIEPTDTGIRLASRCAREGVGLVDRLLGDLANPERAGGAPIPRQSQDLALRSYFGRKPPAELALCFSSEARRIEACVRAADYRPFPSPWGSARARCEGEVVELIEVGLTGRPATDAEPGALREIDGEVAVACADEWLTIRKLGRGGEVGAAVERLAGAKRLDDGA